MTDLSRRDFLKIGGGAGVLAVGGAAGWSYLQSGPDAPTNQVTGEAARELAEQYAPTLYFDSYEQWYPTDPRRYEQETDGETVVDGFTALNDYTEQRETSEGLPAPTVFYNVVSYEDSPLVVAQFWLYSVFDQFTTNFHWHDWEVLHVFHDQEAGEPQLYVASAHGRSVPNNEFLDPDPSMQPRILAELGSHSSALSVNDRPDSFQRLPLSDTIADITNLSVDNIEAVGELPLAYGLPRDELGEVPYAVPELDDQPLDEDDRLPAVGPESLVDETLTFESYRDLVDPPTNLPDRETGTSFAHEGTESDVTYDLVASTDAEHIESFTGPQLSFEFTVPDFAEDAIAGHITTAGVPWQDPRYENPAGDISEPVHRAELADRYEAIAKPSGVGRIIGVVGQTVGDTDAPDGEGVTTEETSVETVALVESDPATVPSFGGVVVADVPPGEHRLTVNGAGYAPHSETVSAPDAEPTAAGVEGEIALTAKSQAVKLQVDAAGTDADLDRLAVEDDFGGRLYDAPLDGPDAVYVDRRGAYTTDVVDAEGERGAYRVRPADEETVTVDQPDTGKAPLARYVADVTTETVTDLRADVGLDDSDDATGGGKPAETGVRGLLQSLEATAQAAQRAASFAEDSDAPGADQRLEVARENLQRAQTRLESARDDIPAARARATERRLSQGTERAQQALDADSLG